VPPLMVPVQRGPCPAYMIQTPAADRLNNAFS
jgi:hypothetical protein